MKKLLIVALCATALMLSCKSKGKVEGPTKADTIAAVIDSIIEENDTTPMPMFIMGTDKEGYLQVLYWSHIEEPQKTDDNDSWYEEYRQSWALQEMFRRNIADYTNLLSDGGKVIKLKFVDEVLKNPDGNRPSIGERHGRNTIPSLCARFTYVNPKDKLEETWNGSVIVTDNYLKSRKRLNIEYDQSEWNKPKALPDFAVKQLEKQYGMKVERMRLCATIGGRYIWGKLQFKGEYKNAPKDEYDKDRKSSLALDVLIDSTKVYVNEEIGMYDEQWGAGWNADDEGEYVGCQILEAFEGPKGLELCFERDAPESSAVGMFYIRGGQLIKHLYETYHNMIDEEEPVWKSDLAEMEKMVIKTNPGEYKGLHFTKWTHVWIPYGPDEVIWIHDKKDEYGAFFSRDDKGQFHLIAMETPRQKPSKVSKDNTGYLVLSGSAGGPATFTEMIGFKNGQQADHFTVLKIAGEIDECSHNGKTISNEEGQAFLNGLPEMEKMEFYGHDTENPEQ